MRRWLAQGLAGALAVGTLSGAVGAAERTGRELAVATYNQYLGADLTPILAAPPAQFNAAVLAVIKQIGDNRFRARAQRQARLIAHAGPDLIGLQEVWQYECVDLPPVAGACADPAIRPALVDQLSVTLAALKAQGAAYRVAALVENFDTTEIVLPGGLQGLPFAIGGKAGLLLAKDRDVILARKGIATRPVAFPVCRKSDDGCTYAVTLRLPLPALGGAEIEFKRGFVGVDTEVGGTRYRFVNTHLEVEAPDPGNPLSMIYQSAQATQLIVTLAATPLGGRELVLVGDMNSSPAERSPGAGIVPPYRQFAAAGYLDAWKAFNRRQPGFTCCQAADLQNVPGELVERIDLVLVGTPPVLVRGANRIGENLADRTPSSPGRPALWPSDHAGVTARLRF